MNPKIETFPVETPALRPLEIVPVRDRSGTFLLVRDPLGVLEGAVLIPADPLVILVLQFADGNTSVGEIASKATYQTGQIISIELVRDIVRQLDDALLLLSDKFVAAWQARRAEYAAQPTRQPSVFRTEGADRLKMLADLGAEFRRHLASPDSPPADLGLAPGSVDAVFAPHIDYQRGGEAYAWSYRALVEAGGAPETYFILGVVHRPAMHRFIATRKAYETPFGPVPCDTELLDRFAAEFGGELFLDEYQHVTEHSIELQVVYLKKLLGERAFKVVPVLVGSFDDLLAFEEPPRQADPEVGAFIGALGKVLAEGAGRVALVGGVDFSHCGPAFGDEVPNSDERARAIEEGDRRALDAIASVDPEGFFDSFREDLNERRVCSIGPIYCALHALRSRGCSAKVQKYMQANSADRSTLVSFASVAFLKPGAGAPSPGRIILLG